MKQVTTVKYRHDGTSDLSNHNHWWAEDERTAHDCLWATIDAIQTLGPRQRRNELNAFLYTRRRGHSYRYPFHNGTMPTPITAATFNVISSVVDTIVAKVSKSKPKIQFLTDGGNWKQVQKAKNLTAYVNGVFKNVGIYQKGAHSFKDACVFGNGVLKLTRNIIERRIDIDRVPIDEIIVDDSDGLYGDPKSLYHVRFVNRWVLKSLYPDHAAYIDQAAGERVQSGGALPSDLIPVAEGWRLPIKADKSDGRYIVAIKNRTLLMENYRQPYFPFLFSRWKAPLSGFFSTGVCDELADVQKEIDRLFVKISKSLDLVATPRVFLHKSSGVTKEQITNKIGHIITYDGPGELRPQFYTPSALPGEVYRHFQWLIESAFQRVGVSELSATSQKPAGLNASVALRTYQDIESERFYPVAASYENMFLEGGELIVQESRELDRILKAQGKPGLKIKGLIGDDKVESITWAEADLKQDEYIMKNWPVNLLPDRPEGKLQTITDFVKLGIYSPEQTQQLLDYPDLKAVQNVSLSRHKLIDRILDRMLHKAEYTTPEPNFPLEYAITQGQAYYSMGKLEGAPDENLAMVLRFIAEAERLIQLKAAKMAPPPAPEAPQPADDAELTPDDIAELEASQQAPEGPPLAPEAPQPAEPIQGEITPVITPTIPTQHSNRSLV